jgi:hypothetical protein
LKVVNNALSQRRLRSDHDQLDSLLPGYFSQRLYISRFNIQIKGDLSRAGIARSGINLLSFRALG